MTNMYISSEVYRLLYIYITNMTMNADNIAIECHNMTYEKLAYNSYDLENILKHYDIEFTYDYNDYNGIYSYKYTFELDRTVNIHMTNDK